MSADAAEGRRRAPWAGIKVVDIAGIGSGKFCAMMLSYMGTDVICIDRVRGTGSDADAARPAGDQPRSQAARRRHCTLGLIERADALIEAFRPAVMERLGLGPDVCLRRNPRLV